MCEGGNRITGEGLVEMQKNKIKIMEMKLKVKRDKNQEEIGDREQGYTMNSCTVLTTYS